MDPLLRSRSRAAFALLSFALFAAPAAAQFDFPDEDEDSQEDAAPPWLHGRLSLRYDHREGRGTNQDRDAAAYLRLRGGSPTRDPVTAAISARGLWDLDGAHPGGAFGSLSDSNDGPFDPRLDEAWLGLHELIDDGEIRLGRQTHWDLPILLHFDGAWLRAPLAATLPLELEAYGGVPEHRWEGSRSGDGLAGLAATLGLWERGSLRLDALQLRDRAVWGDRRDTLYAARASRASLDGRLWGSLSASLRDGDADEAAAEGSWTTPGGALRVDLILRAQLSARADESLDVAPFPTILRELEPYQEGTLLASWTPGGDSPFRVDLGAQGRSLRDSAAASEFNREFERAWAALDFAALPWPGGGVTAGADLWDSGRDRIVAGNLEVRAAPSGWHAALGSGFALYQFDFFSLRERERVREHYLRLRRELGGGWSCRLEFALEHDETESWRRALLGLEVSF